MAMIPIDDRRRLMQLARAALVARVHRQRPPEAPHDLTLSASGVFVTIYCLGELRGCLGALGVHEPLGEVIVRLGGDVAQHDHRFVPLQVHELGGVTLDISVLTPPEVVCDCSDIVVGRDGVIIEHGARRGLLLPQVAPEYGWDRETLLAHACLKAGLAKDAWRNGATILRFEAEVFGEKDLRP
jgi:AmmeMemoRadiSam system protein A